MSSDEALQSHTSVESRRRRWIPALTRRDVQRCRSDDGQAAILVVSVAAVLMVAIVMALGTMGRAALDRTRAQTAADAAALASLSGGRSAAADLAGRHGGDVTTWFRGPGPHEVTVTVRLGESSATARASDAP